MPSYKRGQGIELLKLLHAEIRPQKIAAVESLFSVKVTDIINSNGDLPIRQVEYSELTESDQEGNYGAMELKTSAQRFPSFRLEYDL